MDLSLVRVYDRADGAAWQIIDGVEGTNVSLHYDKNTKTVSVNVRENGTWIGRKTITSSFADVTSNMTPKNSNIVSGTYQLYQSGSLSYIRIGAGPVTLSPGWNVLANVSSAHRPQREMYSFGMAPFGTLRDVNVESNGNVQIYVDSNITGSLRICMIYMV